MQRRSLIGRNILIKFLPTNLPELIPEIKLWNILLVWLIARIGKSQTRLEDHLPLFYGIRWVYILPL